MFVFTLKKGKNPSFARVKRNIPVHGTITAFLLKRCAAAIRRFICARIYIELEREREKVKKKRLLMDGPLSKSSVQLMARSRERLFISSLGEREGGPAQYVIHNRRNTKRQGVIL